MGRVGLIDITVGNAARLGASQRSTTRRCASHHNATQRASRWDIPAAVARFSADGPPQALKRLWLGDGMAFEGGAVQRAADEIEFALRKHDDSAEGASSSHDHPIRMNDFE
jgi:hypothetical protein